MTIPAPRPSVPDLPNAPGIKPPPVEPEPNPFPQLPASEPVPPLGPPAIVAG